jgi:hypothetical protein
MNRHIFMVVGVVSYPREMIFPVPPAAVATDVTTMGGLLNRPDGRGTVTACAVPGDELVLMVVTPAVIALAIWSAVSGFNALLTSSALKISPVWNVLWVLLISLRS